MSRDKPPPFDYIGSAPSEEASLFEGLIFKVADDAERERALALRRRIYSSELGCDGMDELDGRADHLIARNVEGEVLASLRMVQSEHRPFDCEKYVTLTEFVPEGRMPAEVSRFCVEPACRFVHPNHAVHIGMLKLMISFAEANHVSDIVTLVMPHLKNFYRVVFFRRRGDPVQHSTFGTAHFLHLDLVEARARHGRSTSPLARLLFHADHTDFQTSKPRTR